jgi:hypothetical protein
MTSTTDGYSDGHGPKFMGLYVLMLARYLRVPLDALATSLETAGIGVDIQPSPIFIDGPLVG